MRAAPLRLAALLAASLAATAPALAQVEAPLDAEAPANGTSVPEPEESREAGPLANDPVSWLQVVLLVVFLGGVAGVLLYMRKASRDDRRRGLR